MRSPIILSALLWLLALAPAAWADVSIKVPTSVTGGTGALANIQADDGITYNVARNGTLNVGGFEAVGGDISSVVLHVKFSVQAGGYSGNEAIKVNGVPTPVVPASGDTNRTESIELNDFNFKINTWPEITALVVSFRNNDGGSGQSVFIDYAYLVINHTTPVFAPPTWSDEFDDSGPPNPAFWTFEQGFVRNEELQWYQSDNAWQESGNLIVEARREQVLNPNYVAGSTDWKKSRQYAQYTSSSIITRDKYSFQYGRLQVRAKIPCFTGSWPAIWTLGDTGEWPSNGECDIMEYYQVDSILSNCARGTTTRWTAWWDAVKKPVSNFTTFQPNWRNEYHVWTMQWDHQNVRLYVDNHLMNTTAQSSLVNPVTTWGPLEPFKQPHHILLNLAIGSNGGNPANTTFPLRYLVDYVRVWEGLTENNAPTDIALSSNNVSGGLPSGTVVGSLTATDVDAAEIHSYTLVTGTGSTHNASFEIVPLSDETRSSILRTKAVLNHADGATRSIRVRVTDIEGTTFEKALTINVVPTIFQVTYDGNGQTGGSVPEDATNYPTGTSVTVLGNTGNLEKTDSTFIGWNTAPNGSGTSYSAGSTLTITSNVTLYAQWTNLPTYTVAYEVTGANSGTAPFDQIKIQGTPLTLASNYGNLTRVGHTFAGWNSAADGTGTHYNEGATYTIDAAVTLHPEWTLETTAPTLVSTNPSDGATSVEINTSLVATFDEDVTFGTGSIIIRKSEDHSVVGSYDVANPPANLSLDGTTLTITPSSNLAYSTGYHMTIDSTAIEDLAGNAFAGISDPTTWNFSTRPAVSVVFADDFEPGLNPFGGTTPDVASYTVANTSGQANTTLWVRAASGFNSSRNGLIDETENGGTNFTDPDGTQAYGFRYTNTGVTSAVGKIGVLTEGQTITVSFDVCVDGFNAGGAYNALLVLFNDGVARSATESAEKDTAAVLAKASGTTSATNPYQKVSFSHTVGNPVIDNNGAATGGTTAFLSSLLGKDIAIRFAGVTGSANIDNVSVTISGGDDPATLDHFVITGIPAQTVVGTPITGLTITAQDAANATATSFTGTVTFGGTAGITGTSANFVDGVLSGVTITPMLVGEDLTFTVNDGADHNGSTNFAVISVYDNWAGGEFENELTDPAAVANPDGDSLTNLQEFAFGTDPTSPALTPLAYDAGGDLTNPGLPVLEIAGTDQVPSHRAVFVRRKDHQMAGLAYSVEFSADLDWWAPSDAGLSVLTVENSGEDLEVVGVPFPEIVPLQDGGNAAPTFFRVGVSQP